MAVSQFTKDMHLKTLAAVAKILNSADTRNRLGQAKDENEILNILFQRPAVA